jgi:hypothetical protein
MFTSKSRPTWINVEPLSYAAVSTLISKTLHRTKDECAPLSSFITAASSGNAFSARNTLVTLQRQSHVKRSIKSSADLRLIVFTDRVQLGAKSLDVCLSFYHVCTFLTMPSSYDMKSIEKSMDNQTISDPTDLTFLRQHMRELPEEARKYLTWAVFFGET